jgi:hypothetical protein
MEKRRIISATGPNEDGELLWLVHFMSHYYDEGTVPVDERWFALAKTREEALASCEAKIKKAKKRCSKGADVKIDVYTASLEGLIPARDSSNDGRLGYHSNAALRPVELTLEKDKKRYRLAVCLVPIES